MMNMLPQKKAMKQVKRRCATRPAGRRSEMGIDVTCISSRSVLRNRPDDLLNTAALLRARAQCSYGLPHTDTVEQDGCINEALTDHYKPRCPPRPSTRFGLGSGDPEVLSGPRFDGPDADAGMVLAGKARSKGTPVPFWSTSARYSLQ